ncbi:MAG: hypothetical protein ACRC0G_10330 [Fusobacteriaceae bacterium]
MGFRNRYIVITETNKGEVLATLESLKCWKFSLLDGLVEPTKIDDTYFAKDIACFIANNQRLLIFSTGVLQRYKGGFLGYTEIDLVELKSYLK